MYKKYNTVYKEVEVEVDLSDFEIEDLIYELESRGEGPYDITELVQKIWIARRNGKDYHTLLNDLIYIVTGRTV